jgi:Spx/MgsR family transcriptional regulator
MNKITVYGISNCDSIKKTLHWFKMNNIEVSFYDYKKESISKQKLTAWCINSGWEILLNKKSSTWRNLSAELQNRITNQAAAIQIMKEQNSIIKRPVVEYADKLLVGFNEVVFKKEFSRA